MSINFIAAEFLAKINHTDLESTQKFGREASKFVYFDVEKM